MSFPNPCGAAKIIRRSKQPSDAWFHEADAAVWNSPADVKESYRNASIVGQDRVVFNIKGNDYRLVVAVDYRRQIVFINGLEPTRNMIGLM